MDQLRTSDNSTRVRVFCDRKDKDLNNFWSHIVFHPTDAMEDEWGQRILEQIHRDQAVKMVRIYTMFEEMVTLDAQGEMQFDFTYSDYRLDYLVSKGFDILLSYGFVPGFLTEDENDFKPRYKGKKLYMGKVVDYDRWEEICRVFTQHIVDRYGEDTVAKWYLNCYNEPDSGNFFYRSCPDTQTKIQEFCKLYDGFEGGITAVSKKLRLGGPALAGSSRNFEFLAALLTHIRETGRRIDFVNFHKYGTSPKMIGNNEIPFRLNTGLQAVHNLQRILKVCGYEGLPLLWGEWGATSEGYKTVADVPEYAFRDNEVYAAYYVKLLTFWDEQGAPFEKMVLCLSGQDRNQREFWGYRNFFTPNGYPKPIYHAFVLAAKLGSEKLCFYFPDKTLLADRLSVMPSRHEDGHMSILMAYGDDDMIRQLTPGDVTLELHGLDKAYRVRRYLIDSEHANAIAKYRELGCPDAPTEDQKAAIMAASRLESLDMGTVSPENNTLEFTLKNNSVLLLDLHPKN